MSYRRTVERGVDACAAAQVDTGALAAAAASACERGKRHERLWKASAPLSAASAAAGAYLLWRGLRGGNDRALNEGALQVTPVAGPGDARLELAGTF
jgi:hypothetical protein